MNKENKQQILHTITNNASAKLIDRKSTFTAYVFKISSEEEVKEKLTLIKKKHKDASHFPYAFRKANFDFEKEEFTTIERYSDDGEPSKTGGAPLIRILKQKNLYGVLIIVARIFGGIKLGPSGLIKAFSQSAKEALCKTEIIEEEPQLNNELKTDIYHYKIIETVLKQQGIEFKSSFEGSKVTIKIKIPIARKKIIKELERLI